MQNWHVFSTKGMCNVLKMADVTGRYFLTQEQTQSDDLLTMPQARAASPVYTIHVCFVE